MPEIKTCEICGYPLSIGLDGIERCFRRHKKEIKNKRPKYAGKSKFFDYKDKDSFSNIGYAR